MCHRPATGTFVWRLTESNRVEAIPVTIGNLKRDNKIEILSGLTTGDKVVLSGHSFLSEGQEVNIIK